MTECRADYGPQTTANLGSGFATVQDKCTPPSQTIYLTVGSESLGLAADGQCSSTVRCFYREQTLRNLALIQKMVRQADVEVQEYCIDFKISNQNTTSNHLTATPQKKKMPLCSEDSVQVYSDQKLPSSIITEIKISFLFQCYKIHKRDQVWSNSSFRRNLW